MEERTKKLAIMFSIDPDITPPKDMFALFYNFAKEFSESYKKFLSNITGLEDKLRKLIKKRERMGRATVCRMSVVVEEEPSVLEEHI